MDRNTQINAKLFLKNFSCIDDDGNTVKVKGTPRKVTIREISMLQIKTYVRKLCKVFVVYIMNDNEKNNKLKLEDIPILKEFEYIFPEEVLKLPLKRDIDFKIDMIPGAVLA